VRVAAESYHGPGDAGVGARNASDSLYGHRVAPIEPTPITNPGAGEENMCPKVCGIVTECKWSEQLSVSDESQLMQ
jgi:hypothetical protein